MKSRRIVVPKRGAADMMQVVEEDIPEPEHGAVRVKVLTAGVSAYDIMLRSKWLPGFTKVPFTPGVDIVGIVDKPGEGASNVQPGEIVAASTGLIGGGYAEFVCLPATDLVRVPSGLDPAETVCLVANYMTAHLAMYETAQVQSGEQILIHGAAGGVGTALLELGKLAGLQMYGTASKHNHELVSSLGATPIDYRNEDFVERIHTLTGDGVDAAFDPIGGARQIWRSNRALRKGGRLVWFGVAATSRHGIRVIPASLAAIGALKLLPDGKHAPLMQDAGTKGQKDASWYRSTLTELLDYLAAGKIKPIVAARFPLVDAARAHEYLERGGHSGKVVLETEA